MRYALKRRSSLVDSWQAAPIVQVLALTAIFSFDDESAPHAIVVNQTFGRRFFGNRTAIGRRVRIWDRWFTIAGVARDSKYVSPNEAVAPYFFAPPAKLT